VPIRKVAVSGIAHGARRRRLRENTIMSGIQFVTDEKGRKVDVLIDLKKRGAMRGDFWDGLVSESRQKEKGIPLPAIPGEPPQTRLRTCLNPL
jgi:hypothetical protein